MRLNRISLLSLVDLFEIRLLRDVLLLRRLSSGSRTTALGGVIGLMRGITR